MFFTWMIASRMWMEVDVTADPFRMAQEATAEILNLPLRKETGSALPTDKKLVA